MIFVVADDNVLHVVNSEAELQGAFEGIDIEDGIYRFFDDSGAPLAAEFMEPNKKGKLFGIFRWVSSGTYRLVPAELGQQPSLSDVLNSIAGIEENSHFADLQEVKEFLTLRSRPTR
jgi:hypothetical protein